MQCLIHSGASLLSGSTRVGWSELLRDTSVVLHAIRILREEMLDVTYNYIDETAPRRDHSNIFIAAFNTFWARLKLYSYLEMVGGNALYFGTDSVIYKWWPGQPEISFDNFLGDIIHELKDPEDYIMEFVLGGPKNYGYRTHEGKVGCKVRGFNMQGPRRLNNDILKKDVVQKLQEPLLSMDRGRYPCLTHISSRRTKTTSWKRSLKPNTFNWSSTNRPSTPS